MASAFLLATTGGGCPSAKASGGSNPSFPSRVTGMEIDLGKGHVGYPPETQCTASALRLQYSRKRIYLCHAHEGQGERDVFGSYSEVQESHEVKGLLSPSIRCWAFYVLQIPAIAESGEGSGQVVLRKVLETRLVAAFPAQVFLQNRAFPFHLLQSM